MYIYIYIYMYIYIYICALGCSVAIPMAADKIATGRIHMLLVV